MAFWIGILVAALFAWFAFKTSFYETWALMFNILISVYLAVFLGPVITEFIPAAADTPYSNALSMVATAIAAFLILHGITFTFFTSQFKVSFPKVFDILGTGFLGFLAGLLVWSFVSLLIYITPISQNSFIKDIGFKPQSQQANLSYITWWCNLVDNVVTAKETKNSAEKTINKLVEDAKKKMAPKKTSRQKTEPNEPNEPNDAETTINDTTTPRTPSLTLTPKTFRTTHSVEKAQEPSLQ